MYGASNLHACIGSMPTFGALRRPRHGGGLSVREENLPHCAAALNEWAAQKCPVLHTRRLPVM